MSPAASNPWHREALRVLPLAADLHAIDSEAALRVVLLGAGKADDIAERAVARAKAWATLAPLERALIDMLTGAPVTLPDMLAELRHALPESWQAQLPDEHARTEIELTLVSLRSRGLVQITGIDGEAADLLTAWGGFSEAERRETYGAGWAPHTTRAAEAIQECIERQLAAGTAKYVPIIIVPPVGALTPGAAEQAIREHVHATDLRPTLKELGIDDDDEPRNRMFRG